MHTVYVYVLRDARRSHPKVLTSRGAHFLHWRLMGCEPAAASDGAACVRVIEATVSEGGPPTLRRWRASACYGTEFPAPCHHHVSMLQQNLRVAEDPK